MTNFVESFDLLMDADRRRLEAERLQESIRELDTLDKFRRQDMTAIVIRMAMEFAVRFLTGATPSQFHRAIEFTGQVITEMLNNAQEEGQHSLDADFREPYEAKILSFYRTIGIAREF